MQISTDFWGQTVITTFEMTPATAHDLMEHLEAAYREVIRHQPGFLAASLHMNDAMTRICNYSQWARREDYQNPRDAGPQPGDQHSLPRLRAGHV